MPWPDQTPLAPPPPQSSYAMPPAGAPMSPPRSSQQGLAVASLVLGIIAVLLVLPLSRPLVIVLGLVCAVASVICGHVVLSRHPTHRGIAIAGLVLGYIAVALGLVHLVGLVALGVAIRHRVR